MIAIQWRIQQYVLQVSTRNFFFGMCALPRPVVFFVKIGAFQFFFVIDFDYLLIYQHVYIHVYLFIEVMKYTFLHYYNGLNNYILTSFST